ncbi:MAG: DUF389 domain-containing protein [Pseudomonadota bacterium]|nr:DUF389 domain-containing protein [Pseudomonadota bacterium]
MQKQENSTPTTRLQDIFNLHHDQAHPDKIDAAIRANCRVSGTNMWVLMFAIAVASIGLNVNSTAVIIGAMLISPLMGPIVGMGYGAAVGDMGLIRLSLRNIGIFVGLSLLTATFYFLLTPLQEAQSELLARTRPTLWDVLIAFFGGSAGMVAITRKEGGNVVPGVAIATALMPPLCTAGYGLAHGNWQYFFGAFYLFSINCVFIAFSTLLFARLMKLPRRGLVTESRRRLHRIVIAAVVIAVMAPSSYLAVRLVQQELFNTTAANAIRDAQQQQDFFVLRSSSDYKSKQVRLIINGSGNAEKITRTIEQQLENKGISAAKVQVMYAGGNAENIKALEQELAHNKNSSQLLQNQLKEQQDFIQAMRAGLVEQQTHETVLKEIRAQYPEAEKISISDGIAWSRPAASTDGEGSAEKSATTRVVVVNLQLPQALEEKDRARMQAWLAQRFEGKAVQLLLDAAPANR